MTTPARTSASRVGLWPANSLGGRPRRRTGSVLLMKIIMDRSSRRSNHQGTGVVGSTAPVSLHPIVDVGLIGIDAGLRLGRAMAANDAMYSGEATCASRDDARCHVCRLAVSTALGDQRCPDKKLLPILQYPDVVDEGRTVVVDVVRHAARPLLFQLRPVDQGSIVSIDPLNFEEPGLMSRNIADVDYMLLSVCRLSCRGIVADVVLLLCRGRQSRQSQSDSNHQSKRDIANHA